MEVSDLHISKQSNSRRSLTSESESNPIWRSVTSKLQLTDNKELDNSENMLPPKNKTKS